MNIAGRAIARVARQVLHRPPSNSRLVGVADRYRLRDQRIVTHAAGTSGMRTADLLRDIMIGTGPARRGRVRTAARTFLTM